MALVVGAVHDDGVGAENVDVNSRSRGHAARFGHRVHHEGRFGDTQPGPTELRWHGNAKPAAVGHGLLEFVRKLAGVVALVPVVVTELGADSADLILNRLLLFAE